MNRRRFLKYAGATGAVAGVSALGLDYVLSPRPQLVNQSTVTLNPVRSTSKQNHPPVANFKYKPHFLDPTDQQTIQLTPNCYDSDNDPLTYAWYVDGNRVSEQGDYSTKLPVGEHVVRLEVTDGLAQDSVEQSVSVVPDQIYSTRPLHLQYKGICYCVGTIGPEWELGYTPDKEMMDDQLDSIHNDLGCNAIVIMAGGEHEDQLIECGYLAIEKGFDRIYIGPEYMGASPDETVERLERFAPRVKELREASETIGFMVGHEFGLETAIITGDNWFDRLATMNKGTEWDKVADTLPVMFSKIIRLCKRSYGYPISYRAIAIEVDLVPWENPIFESVGVDAYLQESTGWTEDWILAVLSRLKVYRKPVLSTEAGCETFTGAGRVGGNILSGVWEKPYDEDEQANYIKRYCNMLNRARIDGYYYTTYNDNPYFEKGYGLYNPLTKKRKKGFYMYKSYQRTS